MNNGEIHFNIDEVGNSVFNGNLGFRQDIQEYARKRKSVNIIVYNNIDWIKAKTLVKISKWINSLNPTDKTLGFINFLKSQGIRTTRKKFPTTVWKEIGYRQKWCCNVCKQMLKPTFELDHIIALEDDGPDNIDNLQGLCVECHAIKTRDRRLKETKYSLKTVNKNVNTSKYFEEFNYKRRKVN